MSDSDFHKPKNPDKTGKEAALQTITGRLMRDCQPDQNCHLCGHVGVKARHLDEAGVEHRAWQCLGKCERR